MLFHAKKDINDVCLLDLPVLDQPVPEVPNEKQHGEAAKRVGHRGQVCNGLSREGRPDWLDAKQVSGALDTGAGILESQEHRVPR